MKSRQAPVFLGLDTGAVEFAGRVLPGTMVLRSHCRPCRGIRSRRSVWWACCTFGRTGPGSRGECRQWP